MCQWKVGFSCWTNQEYAYGIIQGVNIEKQAIQSDKSKSGLDHVQQYIRNIQVHQTER